MAKANKANPKITAKEVKISWVKTGLKKDEIKFDGIVYSGRDSATMTDMIRKGTDVVLTITSEPEEKGHPPIQASGTMKKMETNMTCQNPVINGLQFSSDQVSQLVGYIRAEAEVVVMIEQPQGELDFEG